MRFVGRPLSSSAIDDIAIIIRRRIASGGGWTSRIVASWAWKCIMRRRSRIRILTSWWGWKWLAVGSIELGGLRTTAIVDCLGGYEGLSLRRDRCEDTFLGKTLTIQAAAVLRRIKARAADLNKQLGI